MKKHNTRKGVFYVHIDILDNPFDYINVFTGIVVLSAEVDYMTQRVKYIGVCKDFDHVEQGFMIPTYRTEFDAGSVSPRWVK